MLKVRNFFVAMVLSVIMFTSVGLVSPVVTMAQTPPASWGSSAVCDVFPFLANLQSFGISSLCGSGDASEAGTGVRNLVQFFLSLIFIGIIIVSVFIVIKAALKYIQSEGDESKIQEAQKAIRSVFIGIAALFIGVIGIVIILAFFNATGAINNTDTPDQIDNVFN
jgi:uncharacterized membrane protein YidH (DUF202 family)